VYNLSLQRGIEGDINSQVPSYDLKNKFAIHQHCFYVDDIYRCVMGMKQPKNIYKPLVPLVWHVILKTNLTHEKIVVLEDTKFSLVERIDLFPHQLFENVVPPFCSSL
jgi:hypothetical protein